MKVLVIGGMHGNETLGLNVVKLFNDNKVNNVETLLANEQAIDADCRFVGQDLNRSFPGNINSKDYEPKRAAQILKLTKKYDLVLDFHNTFCPNNDCSFIGENANQELSDISWILGLDKIIVADYDCINKAAGSCLSIEVSMSSPLNNAELWYDRILTLSRAESFTVRSDVKKFRFVYRMTLKDKDRLELDKRDLKAFQPMDVKIAKAMGLSSPAYPIFIGDNFTPYNYGGVLNEL